ncbi:MAG TPA: hypothetical protein VFH95_05485 [Candidatus Kapabacteria bacterium]|nr:hypothetical protein [Candidatus Kapabacteria bacterium]
MRKLSLLLFLGFATLAGCKSSTSPGSSSSTIVPPKAGSYFIVETTTTDSTGAVSRDTQTDVVAQTNLTIYGKTGVTEVLDSIAFGIDTEYLRYESNGDVSTYQTFGDLSIPSLWVTLPFASQTSTSWVNANASFALYSNGHITETTTGAGSGNATVNGQSLQTEKANLNTSITDTTTFPSYAVSSTSLGITFSFAPSLGYVVESDEPAYRSDGYLNPSTHGQLIGYSLK